MKPWMHATTLVIRNTCFMVYLAFIANNSKQAYIHTYIHYVSGVCDSQIAVIFYIGFNGGYGSNCTDSVGFCPPSNHYCSFTSFPDCLLQVDLQGEMEIW